MTECALRGVKTPMGNNDDTVSDNEMTGVNDNGWRKELVTDGITSIPDRRGWNRR